MNAGMRILLAGMLILPWTVHADQAAQSAQSTSAEAGEAVKHPLTEGEVRRVNKETGRLTIKHGEISNLGMPPMTMNFHVADAAMLEAVQPGDRIRFLVEKINGKYTVMQLEPETR